MKKKVLLVDDHPIVRHGMKQLIDQEDDLCVCSEADDANSAITEIQTHKPDIIIIDIHLGGTNGIDLIKNIRATMNKVPILVISLHEETLYAERALKAGANGYIMKRELTEKIMLALRKVLNNEMYVSDSILSKILHRVSDVGQSPIASDMEVLSDRELDVFRLIGQGYTTRQIADQLHLSVKTIETYRSRVKEKLNLHNTNELLMKAFEWVHNEITT
ncbi:MAG: response regulator transcription factor [Candidatus Omnitrophica bacterium]|nr:response regulator transcription factor [Candidatus Omnitrophota bacterium]